MCVPLISRSKLWGYLCGFCQQAPWLRKEDLDLLTALSSPAAVLSRTPCSTQNTGKDELEDPLAFDIKRRLPISRLFCLDRNRAVIEVWMINDR